MGGIFDNYTPMNFSDFPNDILNEIASMAFGIRELADLRITADRSYAPVVIITSNSEKQLPDPFLRRCVFYDIQFPRDRMREIATGTIRPFDGDDAPVLSEAIEVLEELRKDLHQLEKKPGTSEFLSWLEVVAGAASSSAQPLRRDKALILRTLSLLLKSRDDTTKGRHIIDKWVQSEPPRA